MSDLSFIEKVLDGVDVEWMSLGDIGEFIRGNGMQKKDFSNEGFPAIHYGQIFTRYDLSADKTFTYVPEQLAKKLKKAHKNDLLLATTSENDKDVVKPLAWLGEKTAISGDMTLFRHDQNVKYLAYYFQTSAFQTQKQKYISGAKVRRVSKDNLAKMYVPIPCPKDHKRSLEIQAEIVRTLDAFSAQTQELTRQLAQELSARQKQCDYYRDHLLSFKDNEVDWKLIGEVCELVRGSGLPKADFTESGVPAIHYGQIYTYYGVSTTSTLSFVSSDTASKLKKVNNGDVIITNTSENLEDVGKSLVYLGNEQAVTGGHATILRPSSMILGKYFAYFTQTKEFADKKRKYAKGIKVIDVSANDLSKILIPIPTLKQQDQIVSTLDKLDKVKNTFCDNLLNEIELRKKQYDYYRELLLSFAKPEEAGV